MEAKQRQKSFAFFCFSRRAKEKPLSIEPYNQAEKKVRQLVSLPVAENLIKY